MMAPHILTKKMLVYQHLIIHFERNTGITFHAVALNKPPGWGIGRDSAIADESGGEERCGRGNNAEKQGRRRGRLPTLHAFCGARKRSGERESAEPRLSGPEPRTQIPGRGTRGREPGARAPKPRGSGREPRAPGPGPRDPGPEPRGPNPGPRGAPRRPATASYPSRGSPQSLGASVS